MNMLEDNTYDITLLLGPMYHLYSDEDKITALKEAVRITKTGGHILVAYCMNEATVIQYVFGCNQLKSVMDLNMLTDDWKCISEPKDLFEMVRIEDIERLNAVVPVERVKLVATDGASRYIREYLEEFDDETFAKWQRRLTLAAYELLKEQEKIIDLAVKYGYSNADSFTRAFAKQHGILPTEVSSDTSLKVYPPVSFYVAIKGASELNFKIVDMDEVKLKGISKQFIGKAADRFEQEHIMWSNQHDDVQNQVCKTVEESLLL